METNQLNLEIQLTEKDYVHFQWDHTGLLKPKRWLLYVLFPIVPLAVIYLPYVLQEGFSGLDFSGLYPLLIIPGLILFLYCVIIFKAKSAFKSDPFINHPTHLSVNDEGIFVKAYRSSLNPLWKDVYRYNLTKHAVYIYIAEMKALIIPIRFLTEADKNTLLEFLKQHVNVGNYVKQKRKNRLIRVAGFVVAIGIGVFTALSSGNETDEKLQKAFESDNHSDYTTAIKIYSELIREQPGIASYRLYRAQSEMKSGDFAGAVIDCEEAIRLVPKDGYAYYIYAYALYNSGSPEDACKAIKTSIQLGYAKTTRPFCE